MELRSGKQAELIIKEAERRRCILERRKEKRGKKAGAGKKKGYEDGYNEGYKKGYDESIKS